MGSSPWGRKESDTTEPLSAHTYTHTHRERRSHVMGWPKQVKKKRSEARAGISKEAGIIHFSREGGELGSFWFAVFSVCA